MKIKGVLALATAILILCVIYAANVQMFHINEEGIDVNGIRFPRFYERIDAKIPISNEETVYIELKTTPFSKSTYYECGTESSYAKLNNRFPVCRTIEVRQSDYHSFAGVLEDA